MYGNAHRFQAGTDTSALPLDQMLQLISMLNSSGVPFNLSGSLLQVRCGLIARSGFIKAFHSHKCAGPLLSYCTDSLDW